MCVTPRRRAITCDQLRAMRIVVTQAGPGAGGASKVMLDTNGATLAMQALYAGGTHAYEFEDSDTGSGVRLSVSVPPRKKRRHE